MSISGQLHHVELYVSDLARSAEFWSWLLESFGYQLFQQWDSGRSWQLSDSYIVFVRVDDGFKDIPYYHCRVGFDHLAFHGRSKEHTDQLISEFRARRVTILYRDRHPRAGGYYGVFFEDPDRIKVEVVAAEADCARCVV
jgi:catechol 2,3-dioxygenase-like lactoylglutathione lyase family enzyme